MKEGYTIFSLRTCGPGSRHIAPGRAQRIMFQALGVTADEVGGMFPAPDGSLDIEVSLTRGRRRAPLPTMAATIQTLSRANPESRGGSAMKGS